jgi:hypothetical protein
MILAGRIHPEPDRITRRPKAGLPSSMNQEG